MAADPESESESESESEWEVEVEVEVIEEGELEKLEAEVREMAKKVSEYRKTLPEHLRNTLDSALSSFSSSHSHSHSHNSFPNFASGSGPLPSSSAPPGTEEQECVEKMIKLKEIVSRNAQNIPKLVKRVRDCTHQLDSLDATTSIHPAFTRRRLH